MAQVSRRTVGRVVRVTLTDPVTHQSQTITATEDHPFYVQGKGFVPAGQLGIGTSIVTRAGPALTVSGARWMPEQVGGYTVYNLTVEGDHTYFVGSAGGGAWVHNANCKWIRNAKLVPGIGGGVTQGKVLSVKQALDAIRRGDDVIANDRSLAESLAKAAAGTNKTVGPEIHGVPADGFLWHFHPDPRTGSHVFYP